MKKILALLFALLASPAAAQTIPSGPWGSINYWGVGGLSQVLTPGLAGQCLETQGVGSAPIWIACPGSALNLLPSINTNQFYGNVSGNFAPPVGVDVNTILNTVGYDIARPPTVESILYKSNVGPNFNWQALPPAPQGQILTSGGLTNPPFWSPSPTQSNLGSICTTVGALLYFDTPSLLWKCIAPGTSGQLLQTGGAGANPSWLTVTLATLGGVPSTRNVNTSAPLGGGGALSSDLTLTCPTCATTTNGGALSATAPVAISASGVIACSTCATTTNGGALSATAPIVISAAGAISMANQGTTTTVLHGNAAGNPAFSAVAISTDVSGLGTGIATALGVNVGSAGAPVLFNGVGGTPSSLTLTNATGLPTTGLTGTLQAAQEPAHTGDCTNTAGSLALTCLKTNNVAFTAGATAAAGQLPGEPSTGNASAGNVGEYVESIIPSGSAVAMTSGTAKDITTISLTAGDWDIRSNVYAAPAATTSVTFVTNSISLTLNTVDTTVNRWNQFATAAEVDGGITFSVPVVPVRFSLSTTTTIHLVANAGFTVSTLSAYGGISARRAR